MMDGMYPRMVSQWTRTKMQRMVERGYWCGVLPSLGYRVQPVDGFTTTLRSGTEPPTRLIVQEVEANTVRYSFDLFLETRTIASVRDCLRNATGRQ